MRLFTLASILALFTASCQEAGSGQATFDITKVKAAIDEANKTYGERARQKDLAFYAARYTKDACTMPPDTIRLCGHEAIRGYFTADTSDYKVLVTADDVFGGADGVTETGTYEVQDGKGKQLGKGKFVAAWKEEDGKWKIHREVWNSDKAPGQ
jgi:ketosteroid isomerase-like protein